MEYTEEMIDLAVGMAEKAHKGQRYGEHSYMYHLAGVADMVVKISGYKPDSQHEYLFKIVSYLHDALEDTDLTYKDIRYKFGVRVAKAVKDLTHKKDEKYSDYIKRIYRFRTPRIVKIADLMFNIENIPDGATGKFKHMRDKYELALKLLDR